jgi:hypothetical protein
MPSSRWGISRPRKRSVSLTLSPSSKNRRTALIFTSYADRAFVATHRGAHWGLRFPDTSGPARQERRHLLKPRCRSGRSHSGANSRARPDHGNDRSRSDQRQIGRRTPIRFVLSGERFSAISRDGKTPRGPVAVLTPVDPLLHDRVDVLFRFRDALIHHRAAPDSCLTRREAAGEGAFSLFANPNSESPPFRRDALPITRPFCVRKGRSPRSFRRRPGSGRW